MQTVCLKCLHAEHRYGACFCPRCGDALVVPELAQHRAIAQVPGDFFDRMAQAATGLVSQEAMNRMAQGVRAT